MQTIKVLFVGGIADGRRMEVNERQRVIYIPELPEVPTLAAVECPPDGAPEVKQHTYFVHQHLTDHGALYFATKRNFLEPHAMLSAPWDGYRVGQGDAE